MLKYYRDSQNGKVFQVLPGCNRDLSNCVFEGYGIPDQPARSDYKTQRSYEAAIDRMVTCDECGSEVQNVSAS